MNDPPRAGPDDLSRQVRKRALRKARGRRDRHRSVWFGLGMFGLVGWSVAVPAVIGAAIGRWLDERWPSEVSWTLTLLIIGVGLGCAVAAYWVRQEAPK